MIQKITFWSLLSDSGIQIPLYQRDYVQGRASEDVSYIRKAFVQDLIKALISDDSSLALDLVFGSTEHGRFIPVDGQQRLTTLFLVHWLVAFHEGKLNENHKTFSKFTYLTRPSSSGFFSFLAHFNDVNNAVEDITVKERIKNSPSFFAIWENDPTVKGVLVMLQDIDDKIKKSHSNDRLWEKLTEPSRCPIIFSVVNLDDDNSPEQLYIRMNARGKQLTDFENFKAWLNGKINKESWETGFKVWETALDTTWLDLFWNYKDEDDYLVDQEYMRFFNGMAQIAVALSPPNNEENTKENIQRFVKKGDEEIHIPLALYEKIECFSEKWVRTSFQILQKIMEYSVDNLNDKKEKWKVKWFADEDSVFKSFISGKAITFEDRVRFYAIYSYLLTHTEETNENVTDNFLDWSRFIRNLLSNTVISTDNMANVLRSIESLIEETINLSILEILVSGSEIKPFTKDQVKEEQRKAKLIQKDPAWRDFFLEAENHSLFQGSISFLLVPDSEEDACEDFQRRLETAKKLFDESGASKKHGLKEDYLLIRAMIAKLEKQFGWNESIVFKEDKSSWRVLLKNDGVQKAIRKIIHGCNNEVPIIEYLNEICESCPDEPLWRKRLVQYPELLSDDHISSSKKVQKYYGGKIYLYNGTIITNAIEIETYRNQVISGLLYDKNSPWDLKVTEWAEKKLKTEFFYSLYNWKTTLESNEFQIDFYQDRVNVKMNEQDHYILQGDSIYPPKKEDDIEPCIEKIKETIRKKQE